jgi:DNA repair protein RadC
MENLHTSFYKPTKFEANEKGVENYQTGKKETIAYKNIFQPSLNDAELDHKAGSGEIWRKGSSYASLAHKLKKGEFAVVERKYSEVGMFEFTTRDNNKINNSADVAFIFRQLESEAVEHAFAVYVDKEKNPYVQWLSMGGINSTIIDPRLMVDAAQRLKATHIYFVHNHPSGSLIPSSADIKMVEKLKKGFEPMGINVNAIIINLNSGNYLIFDENGCTVEREGFTSSDFEREEKVGVFSFNKQAFIQSPTDKKIQSPSDVAQFLSQQKFSSGEKAGYLLLTMKNEIVGNFFATQSTRNKAYKEVAGLVSKFGAVNVVAYTNKAGINFYNDLKADLHNLEINLHDVIECESSAFVFQTFEKYKSLAQEGLLNEKETNYNTKKSKTMEPQNRNQVPPNPDLKPDDFPDFEIDNFDKMHQNSMDRGDEIYMPEEYTLNEIREDETNFKKNKSKIMQTQNTLSEENLTNQGEELNNNEETYLQKNLDYINNQIKYLGFGEGFNEALKEAMKSGKEKIDFPISKEFFSPGSSEKSKPVDFTLHFNKGKESNMYFLNSYSAQLQSPTSEINQEQKFYLNKGKGFTAKEAFNLLSDRAVNKDLTNKEGVTYNAWVKLKPAEKDGEKGNRDFQIFNENYGFDLKESLSKYPIKEMETPEAADKLMNSLKKGNLQAVTFSETGGDVPKFIEANPQYKNINIYQEDGKKQFIPHGKSETQNATNQRPTEEPVFKENKSAGIKR